MDHTTDPAPGVLTRLPLWARHLVLLLAPAGVIATGLVLRAIVAAGGVLTDVDWAATAAAAASGISLWALMVLTPIERRYGVGSTPQTRAQATVLVTPVARRIDARNWAQAPDPDSEEGR